MFPFTILRGNRIGLLVTMALMGFVVLAAWQMPVRAQSSSSLISISVPVTLQLEGTTVSAVPAGSPVLGQLTVKSNVPWALVVDVDAGGPALVAWAENTWRLLPAHGVVLRGPKGVHHLMYYLRVAPAGKSATVVRFSLDPSL